MCRVNGQESLAAIQMVNIGSPTYICVIVIAIVNSRFLILAISIAPLQIHSYSEALTSTGVQDKIPLDKIPPDKIPPGQKPPRTKAPPIFGRTKSPPDIIPPEKKCYKSLSVN